MTNRLTLLDCQKENKPQSDGYQITTIFFLNCISLFKAPQTEGYQILKHFQITTEGFHFDTIMCILQHLCNVRGKINPRIGAIRLDNTSRLLPRAFT